MSFLSFLLRLSSFWGVVTLFGMVAAVSLRDCVVFLLHFCCFLEGWDVVFVVFVAFVTSVVFFGGW